MAFFSRVSFRRRDRELAAAAGIVLAAAALLLTLVGNMISDNQKTMIQMQSGQLRSISESVAKQIEVFADEMASDLEMETKLNQFIEAERSLEQGQQEPMAQLLEEFLEGREGSVEGMAWESGGQRIECWAEGQEPLTLQTASFMTEENADLAVSILQDENGCPHKNGKKRVCDGEILRRTDSHAPGGGADWPEGSVRQNGNVSGSGFYRFNTIN